VKSAQEETELVTPGYKELCLLMTISEDANMQPELTEANEQMARYISMVVRNAMENFHCEHLSDEQMKQLNPLIRNAVATALHAFEHYERVPAARGYVDHQFRRIPSYWEKPELLEGYRQMLQQDGQS
jgi:hypothetical protein